MNEDECDIPVLENMLNAISINKVTNINFLSFLISNLEGLLDDLKVIKKDWKRKFKSECIELEIIYTIALDEERDFLNSQDQKIIGDVLQNMKNLVIEEKQNQIKQFQGKTGILAEENWVICPYCFEPLEPPQTDLVLVCPKCSQCFSNPLQNKTRSQEKHDDN